MSIPNSSIIRREVLLEPVSQLQLFWHLSGPTIMVVEYLPCRASTRTQNRDHVMWQVPNGAHGPAREFWEALLSHNSCWRLCIQVCSNPSIFRPPVILGMLWLNKQLYYSFSHEMLPLSVWGMYFLYSVFLNFQGAFVFTILSCFFDFMTLRCILL